MPPYTLTTEQLDAALATLAKAAETFRLSPLERRLYGALKICATVAAVGFLVELVLLLVGGGCIAFVLAPIAILAGVAATILLAANFRLWLKTSRHRRLLQHLGLRDVSYSAWKAQRERHRWRRIRGVVVTMAGVVLLLVAMVGTMGIVVDKASTDTSTVVIFAVCAVFGATTLLWRSLERSRERLEILNDADNLRATLASLQGSPEASVEVPAAVLENVARIEQAQIVRERTHAVLASVSAADRGYGVQLAHDVLKQKASLPPDTRLDVEELIDALTAAPYPTESQRGEGALRARTPDQSAEVEYSVDEENRRIRVLSIRTERSSHAV